MGGNVVNSFHALSSMLRFARNWSGVPQACFPFLGAELDNPAYLVVASGHGSEFPPAEWECE